ncbi:cytochrome oxidase maturation protein, cbb3-type [Hahella sp. CCB-MM4]|uniref:cbb3-type cytochrome oxidase assembly protein CcoS n=1 Tax=Hahella sp. (strain CCB-MM4) TaxID=1926491 RepID=UPI000B9A662A|nr:cbb3-type cytochrome oxidase assembly protein CcoS [Hahella sp. CCB-MM4]OZG73739.1 cytochrome oxidase maturation protein, cbb3-type [Hahella sp. CCB-MM4]
MQILFVLIPLSILLLTIAVLIFRWAVKSGQYDDLKGPAHSILFDDDKHMEPTTSKDASDKASETPEQQNQASSNQDSTDKSL